MPILLIVFCICPCGRKCIGLDRPPRQNPDVPAADIDGPVVTTGVVVGTVPPAGEAQNVPLVAAKSEV